MDKKLIESLCKNLRCLDLATDLDRLDHARDMLLRLQQREIFSDKVSNRKYYRRHHATFKKLSDEEVFAAKSSMETEGDTEGDDTNLTESVEDLCAEDTFQGTFKGFKIISDIEEFRFCENKKCVEITKTECSEALEFHLRCGIRCFCIDLFEGTHQENQKVIVRLRECEYSTSKEYGFPVMTTLIAKLNPRLPYVGVLDPRQAELVLDKGHEIVMTVDRYWATRSSERICYFNAKFAITQLEICDIMLIGPDIQVKIESIEGDFLKCKVIEGGLLTSRLPLRLPGRISRTRLSIEELEDLTFANEVGINVVVTHFYGPEDYFHHMRQSMRLLRCDRMRLFARVVLNTMPGDDRNLDWVAEYYDGFIMEVQPQKDEMEGPEILEISPAAEAFYNLAFDLKKAIIFDPANVASKRCLILPKHHLYFYLFPERFIFKCESIWDSFYWFLLHKQYYGALPQTELTDVHFCDCSQTGSDTLARSLVISTHNSCAKVIFVCTLNAAMVKKIAHYRPSVPIILITSLKSVGSYIMIYHNVLMLYFPDEDGCTYEESIYKQFLFGVLYASARNIIVGGENVLFVYGNDPPGNLYPDKFVVYKFDNKHVAEHLKGILFTPSPRDGGEDGQAESGAE